MNAEPFYYTWNYQSATNMFPVASAEHDEFVLQDGRRIYDMISTSFQANFGHSNRVITDAIRDQLDRMPIASPKASFGLKRQVSERLAALLGLDGGKVFYTVSGSEAVENALKMARQTSGRSKVLARHNSYHGASLGALSVTGDWRNEPHFTVDSQTVRVPEPDDDPDLKLTREIISQVGASNIAAFILETVSGTNGVVVPDPSWMEGVQAMCREFGIYIILDEVLCGFGRTGPAFAFQSYDVQPDFVCTSKGITGGYIPFGAVWTAPRVVEYYDRHKLVCGLTNYAHPLGLAALGAVLDLMGDSDFCENKSRLEEQFEKWLREIGTWDFVREVRCSGLLAAIELDRPAPSWEAFFARGLHVYSKDRRIVLAPPFVSREERLQQAFEQFQATLFESPDVRADQTQKTAAN